MYTIHTTFHSILISFKAKDIILSLLSAVKASLISRPEEKREGLVSAVRACT